MNIGPNTEPCGTPLRGNEISYLENHLSYKIRSILIFFRKKPFLFSVSHHIAPKQKEMAEICQKKKKKS